LLKTPKEDKKVLIVEDEFIVARNLRMIIENLGYGVLGVAPTGQEALRLIEESACNPQLVLMDITLKGPIDGVETARRMQDKCETPIMFITGNKDQRTIERAVESTMPLALINKPFNVDLLKSLITDTLDPESMSSETPFNNNRVSERLPIPSGDKVLFHIRGTEHEFLATLKNLSMTGAGVIAKRLILGMEKIEVTITPDASFKEITSSANVRHMTMVNDMYYYGIQFELDREAQKALAAYYSYLNRKWSSAL